MPRLSAWFVRTSLAYLAIGFTLGSLMLINEGLPFAPQLSNVLPAHIEILTMGWVMQLALGVAYWILPRFSRGLPRGNVVVAWASLVLINIGILFVACSVFIQAAGLTLLGRFLEVVSILLFISVTWRRVRSSF